MARSRGFIRRAQSGHKRLTEWGNLADQGFVAVSSAGATLISSTSFESPGTIVRSRGMISLRFAAHNADVSVVGAFGIGLVSAEALAVGITAVPEPFTDSDWGGWMTWQPFARRLEFSDATGLYSEDWEYVIDSKAMRKVEPNSAMVFVAESQQGAFQISETVRLLLKLH